MDLALMPRLRPPPFKKELWEKIHSTVRENGGWITSAAHAYPIRLECVPGSGLPDTLRSLGYIVTFAGTVERLLPRVEMTVPLGGGPLTKKIARDQVVATQVEIFEIALP